MTVCSCHITYVFQSESTLHICLNVKGLLARNRHEIWSLSDCSWAWTHNYLVRKWTLNHLAKLALNDWAVLWVLVCTVYLTVCSCHVTYTFQSESTLHICLNVKELLARNRHKIWIPTHNHLVHKRTLNHLAKLANLSIILDIVWSPERHV